MLIIGTIDEAQLKPISGLPVLTSPHMLTSFDVVTLQHCVRAEDADFRRLVKLIRLPVLELREEPEKRESDLFCPRRLTGSIPGQMSPYL